VIKRSIGGASQLLTAQEIAGVLKISLNTVHSREWKQRNGCPLIKIGKRTYVLEAAFWQWVDKKGMSVDVEND